ncbi:antibiotic biosynthesis monooxygenase family protein [Micromonospora thermarum]|uniref:Antibiotic biosynthesis monooxygenase n=1 Tax=Micromonospora thermarum TaxID=2720024 RepID=A0ABX0Z694_9ACTN|nr:antibiotic biosynthesis monooxygenase family protein [Micromonospora thermarum]NJP33371.1 antibiotic biosynthesis monooxygenase [Micromonospora thermarum]
MSDQVARSTSDEAGPEGAAPAGPHRVRVLVYAAAPSGEPDAVATAYHRISRDLAGTPGLLRNELLRAADDDRAFVVMSEWTSLDAFRDWEAGAAHRGTTAPLRDYQRVPGPRPFGVYEVTATY